MADLGGVVLRPEAVRRRLPVLVGLMATLVVLGLLIAVLVAGLIVARPSGAAAADPGLIAPASLLLVCGLAIAVVASAGIRLFVRSAVVLTPEGLVNRQIRDRLIPWSSITELETLPRGAHWRVRIRLDDGRRVMLTAPHTRAPAPHPQFRTDRDTIVAWWRRHTSAAGSAGT